ncbi:MAG TPA: DNA-formamidopyrimidine glycosylase family protein [Nitrospirota bacterium]|nr:DNA-formamidopyrimidine glycosylase family protein [Nitrospirota bacterium]
MPELPDIVVYIEALEKRIMNRLLKGLRIVHPFLLRTAEPPVSAVEGKQVLELRRIGRRIAIGLEDDLWLLVHLMISGRLHWREPGVVLRGKGDLASFDFTGGSLVLNEAGTKKRASLHIVHGQANLLAFDQGGIDVLRAGRETFAAALTRTNHTVKRALTDPHLFSGIGNAYSDEILFRARLSPVVLTQRLAPGEIERLHRAARETLTEWIDRLRRETGDGFPEKVTAFRKGMAVHGRFRQPCPTCGTPVQRIRYATNEANYCARCQTSGRFLADRALSRLLKEDWPRTIDELEDRHGH